MEVKVIHNGHGSSDWMVVTFNGNVVFQGSLIDPFQLASILDECIGYTKVSMEPVTDRAISKYYGH